MTPPRRLKVLTTTRLSSLTEERLLSYRKKALSLEDSPEDSDYSTDEVNSLDPNYIWFKSDPRWKPAYDDILAALARLQSSRLKHLRPPNSG
jgi:hypothetical protein